MTLVIMRRSKSTQKHPQHRFLPQRFTPFQSVRWSVSCPESVRWRSKLHSKVLPQPVMASNDSERVYPGPILEASSIFGPFTAETPIFYTHVLCPFAERVWLTLLEKQVAHTLVHVDLSRKPSWYKSLNPRGLVPCVAYKADNIIESEDICRWIDKQFEGPSLMPPPDGPSRQSAEVAIRLSSTAVAACLDVISANNHTSWSVGKNASQQQLDSFVSACDKLGQIAREADGPFILGDSPGVADMMSWPFVHRALFCSRCFSGFDAMAAGSGLGKHARTWVTAMQSRESVQMTLPDDVLLQQALERTGRLDWFDYETATVNRLHPHLATTAQPA